jgi:hypothetical protein
VNLDRIEFHELEIQSRADSDADALYRHIMPDMPEAGESTYLEKAGRPFILSLIDKIEQAFLFKRHAKVHVEN